MLTIDHFLKSGAPLLGLAKSIYIIFNLFQIKKHDVPIKMIDEKKT